MRYERLQVGRDFFAHLAARDPVNRRLRRLFERGVIAAVTEDYATVNVGRRDDGTDILLEDVPVASGYNPAVGDWVTLRYDGGCGGAPMVFGPSIASDTEEPPSTSSQEVLDARSSARHGSHGSLDARLEAHEQAGNDPHGASLTQSVRVRTPLIDATGNLNLLPAGALLIGQVGGSYRKLAFGDDPAAPADGVVLGSVTLSAPPAGTTQELARLVLNTSWSASKSSRALVGATWVKGAGMAANAAGIHAAAYSDSSATAPLLIGVEAVAGMYTGAGAANVTEARGASIGVTNQGSGTLASGTALRIGDAGGSGPITTLVGIDIPALTRGTTNYLMRLGAGTVLANGNLTLLSGAAGYVPLTVKAAGSQTADLQQWHNDSGTTLTRVSKDGWLGIGASPTTCLEVAGALGPLARLTYRTTDGTPSALQLRTCRGALTAPTAVQTGDRLANVQAAGYRGTGWSSPTAIWRMIATEAFTETANGTKMDWAVTRAGTVTNFVAMTLDHNGYLGLGQAMPSTQLELEESAVLTASTEDGYAAALTLDPAYSGQGQARTVARHNYMDLQNVSTTAQASVTDACVIRFDAAAGTHRAVDSQTTKETPGYVDAWIKVNISGLVHYVPAYASKTS